MTEPGIATNGTFSNLLPNWLAFDHLINTTKACDKTLTSCLVNYLSESKSAAEMGTIFDFLAMRKNLKRNKHQYVTSSDFDMSKCACISFKSCRVMGRALLGLWFFETS